VGARRLFEEARQLAGRELQNLYGYYRKRIDGLDALPAPLDLED
jgi:hypothetical protein